MNEENIEQPEAHQNQDVESNTQDDTSVEDTLSPEEIADLKKKAEVSSQNYERAKKAEEELRRFKNSEKKEVVQKDDVSLSPKDYLALTENRVSSEDFDEVVRVAKILNKPISEALKDKTLKSILSERQEERNTAVATQTRSPRSSTKDTIDVVLEKARKGNVPTDDADIEKLAQAHMAERLRQSKR